MSVNVNFSKLAFLEKLAIGFLDIFIDSRGARGVPMKSFPGEVGWAHEYNLRFYIGRNERQIEEFIGHRPYLWTIDQKGNVHKLPDFQRRGLLEAAIILNENIVKKGKNETTLAELVTALGSRLKSGEWPALGNWHVKSVLEQHPELFKMHVHDGETPIGEIIFSCLVVTVDNTILPRCVTTSITADMVKALDATPVSAVGSIAAAKSATSIPPRPISPKPIPTKSTPAKLIQATVGDECLEGVGWVALVSDEYGFLNTKKSNSEYDIENDVFFHWTAFDKVPPKQLTHYVKVGDRLAFKAGINASYNYSCAGGVCKWRAVSVSKNLPTAVNVIPATKPKPKPASASASSGEWTTVGQKQAKLSAPIGGDRLSNATAATGSRDRPGNFGDQKSRELVSWDASDESWSEIGEDALNNARETSFDRVASLFARFEKNCSLDDADAKNEQRREDEKKKLVKELIPEPAAIVAYSDIGCQTEATDEELLLRMLQACPTLLDHFKVVSY